MFLEFSFTTNPLARGLYKITVRKDNFKDNILLKWIAFMLKGETSLNNHFLNRNILPYIPDVPYLAKTLTFSLGKATLQNYIEVYQLVYNKDFF